MTINTIGRLLIAVTLVGLPQFGRAASPTLSAAEQEVIEVLLRHEGPSGASGIKVLQEMASVSEIRRESSHEDFARRLRLWGLGEESRPPKVQQSLEDFLTKNRTDTQIVFPTNATPVQLVPASLVEEILRTNGWSGFYRRFPGSGGYAVISRVGFDSKNTIAMVYLGVHHGPLSGRGRIYVLSRENGKWTVTHENIGPEWVS
jgi:hypothetical protein